MTGKQLTDAQIDHLRQAGGTRGKALWNDKTIERQELLGMVAMLVACFAIEEELPLLTMLEIVQSVAEDWHLDMGLTQ